MSVTRRVPLSSPWLDEREAELVLDVLRSGRLSLGPTIDRFEEAFADAVEAPYAVAVSSGTAGLHLLCIAAGVGQGDEVITSPYSFVASANCAIYEGATPVFADIDPHTLNLDPAAVEAAVTERTTAVVAVDIYGYPCELDELRAICDRHGLAFIQDACEALGARYRGQLLGSHGPSAVFAFYPNKQITTGEGGMIVTHDEQVASRVKSLRNQGRGQSGEWFEHDELGYNYRLSEMSCALGIFQLKRLEAIMARREEVARAYARKLAGHPAVILPSDEIAGGRMSWFVYVIRLNDNFTRHDRDRIVSEMNRRGIGCGRYFAPIHLQSFYRKSFSYEPGSLPITERVAARTLALPFFNRITENQINIVCRILTELIKS